jgi:hypothetical protein
MPITTGRVDTDEEPDEYIQDSEFPDYATNWDGTVISLGGPRKKKGKRMRLFPDWAKTHNGRWYPTSYFTLAKDKQSHRQTQAQMLMRRRKQWRSAGRCNPVFLQEEVWNGANPVFLSIEDTNRKTDPPGSGSVSVHLGTVQPFPLMTPPRRQGSTIIGGQKQNYGQA